MTAVTTVARPWLCTGFETQVVLCCCKSFRLSSDDGVSVTCQCVEDLFCTHEEADTRLLLHAKHAADSGAPSVVIRSPDTDVAVLCCHVQSHLQIPIYFRTGTQTQTRYVDISGVCKSLPDSMCDILPAVHALTGCDATSASVGKGKSAGYQFALSIPALREDLRHLGVSFEVSEELQRICEKFVCS